MREIMGDRGKIMGEYILLEVVIYFFNGGMSGNNG